MKITEQGIYDDLPNDVYHADPVPDGSLSVSGMKKLLPPSCPAIFHAERGVEEVKSIYDTGHAAHRKVLGVGPEIEVIPGERWDTNVAKEKVKAAREAGRIPVKQGRADTVDAMAEALLAHPFASTLFTKGKAEQSAFWQDERTGVWLRCRFDWLPEPVGGRRMIVPDYKTAASGNPEKWAKSAADHGYFMQDALYTQAIRHFGIDEDPAFVFVVQEKTPPYVVTVLEFTEDDKRFGDVMNRRAIDIYKRCIDANHWPGHADDEVVQVALPAWFTSRHEEPFVHLSEESA